jgi:hypothetical protein
MSEDKTKETQDARTFEERVFARFDAVDERFDRVEGQLSAVEIRITKLEAKEYDTKPIWERALAEVAETNRKLTELVLEFRASNKALGLEFQSANQVLRNDLRFEFLTLNEALRNDLRSELQTSLEGLRTDLRSEFQSGIEGLRTEMKAEFAGLRHSMQHELRGVARKLDTLNHDFLEMRTEQRFLDRQLEELETQIKTT